MASILEYAVAAEAEDDAAEALDVEQSGSEVKGGRAKTKALVKSGKPVTFPSLLLLWRQRWAAAYLRGCKSEAASGKVARRTCLWECALYQRLSYGGIFAF